MSPIIEIEELRSEKDPVILIDARAGADARQRYDAGHLPSTYRRFQQPVGAVSQERDVVNEIDERDVGAIQAGRPVIVVQVVRVVIIVQVTHAVIACRRIDCPRQRISCLKLKVPTDLTVQFGLEAIVM